MQKATQRSERVGVRRILAAAVLMATPLAAWAQIVIPANNLGTDGALNPFQNRTIALGAAVTGQWDQPGNGNGVYDPQKWVVVYKYTSVSIPLNVTVNFANHPSGAPVVWLVSGDVTINGTLSLDGQAGTGVTGFTVPGPGGFGGGKRTPAPATAGFGPGGGPTNGGGGFGTFGVSQTAGNVGGYVYGTADLIPLIGGSGGGATDVPGGAGGGGILIVATGTITVNGTISANGGSTSGGCCGTGGGGSGGGIRLVANTITGGNAGRLNAIGGTSAWPGGFGRIRTESNLDSFVGNAQPTRSTATVGTTAKLWPDNTAPSVTAVSLGNKPVPADPRGLFTFGNTDVELNATTPAVLTINCANVPVNALVEVRIVPVTQNQNEIRVPATFQTGSLAASVWSATLPVTNGVSSFTVSVTLP